MNASEETCECCHRSIARQEQAYVTNGKVVCEQCDKKLRAMETPTARETGAQGPLPPARCNDVGKTATASAGSSGEEEKVLSYVGFIAPDRHNIARQKWFAVLTNRRLLFYATKGGGEATFTGAVQGAAIGLGVGFVLALIGGPRDFLLRFAGLGTIGGVVVAIVMGTKRSVGQSEQQVVPNDARSLDSSLRESPEHYEFVRPSVPQYVERTPFMGGITINLGQRRRMSFVHDPPYSEIKRILHAAKEPDGGAQV